MPDEDIEKLIERKVEEKMDEKRKEVREEVKEELGVSESGEDKHEDEKEGLSRRSFLKMLGVGAGSLALSSSVAGAEWSLIQPTSQGKSDVEAEKASMGSAPFQLLGNLEAKDGELIWDESNSHIPASSINQSGISHDNLSSVSADDHHPEVSAGTNISVNSSNTVSVSPQGEGSGLNADMLDGQEPSEIGSTIFLSGGTSTFSQSALFAAGTFKQTTEFGSATFSGDVTFSRTAPVRSIYVQFDANNTSFADVTGNVTVASQTAGFNFGNGVGSGFTVTTSVGISAKIAKSGSSIPVTASVNINATKNSPNIDATVGVRQDKILDSF